MAGFDKINFNVRPIILTRLDQTAIHDREYKYLNFITYSVTFRKHLLLVSEQASYDLNPMNTVSF